MLLRALAEEFDSYNQKHRKPRTAEFYRQRLAGFVKAHGEARAEDLRPHHVYAFKATWHLVLAVQRLYRWASEEMEFIATNPMVKIKRPRLGARRRILERRELCRLLRRAPAALRRFLLAARETAARPQELRELAWQDLHWQGDYRTMAVELAAGRAWFNLVEFKGRERRADATAERIIPVSPRFGRLLARLARGRPREGVIFRRDNRQAWNKNALRMSLRRVLLAAGLAGKVRGEGVCLYTLRHTAATELVRQGLEAFHVKTMLGHANVKTTQRYIHISRAILMEEWQKFHDRRK